MTDLEKVTAQRDLLLAIINQSIKLSVNENEFTFGYVIANLTQVVKSVEKDMQNAR